MTGIFLQRMVENLPEGCLPANWLDFDMASFSRGKRLYEYQQTALKNALLALWKYYSPQETGEVLKQAYMAWYQDFGLEADLDLPLDRSSAAKRRLTSLLESYYTSADDRLPYEQFINRMSFWMATGSGKTLVIVKLLEILHGLIGRGEIPAHDILVLAHRDDLIEQLRQHVNEFNAGGGLYIKLRELREYAEVKREAPSLFHGQEMTVFYYRSDNLSDEQKEKIIDFRSYDNHGKWYILLDEAHKGDKEDSKRQYIYSILSRDGFLFNFSATFTDERDIVATVANYNLSEFVRKGHGKHISVLKQEVRAFRSPPPPLERGGRRDAPPFSRGAEGDYTDAEKQKIILKALMMIGYIRQFEQRVRQVRSDLYHRPLLMALVNSVNTEDADLKLFFRELVRIGKGEVDAETWSTAKAELRTELLGRPDYLFEDEIKVRVDDGLLAALSQADLLCDVYNANGAGEIEVLVRPSNRQEVAFKLKTSDDPFALVRIGDISDWLKQELAGYEINQHFADEGYFERLNHPDSDINILLGSRSFYEGWDSNRPNVIMYVNIGTGTDAKKFILQSVGRGVRIEPFKNQRKRLRELHAGEILSEQEAQIFEAIKNHVLPLESLFIFGTNREALNLVIGELDQQDKAAGEYEIALEVNEEAVQGKLLLIPVYQSAEVPLYKNRDLAKFALSPENMDLLRRYLEYINDDRVLLAIHDTYQPEQILALRSSMGDAQDTFRTDGRAYKNLNVLARQALQFFSVHGKEFGEFKPLEDEINHFRHIKVALEEADFASFELQLRRFLESPERLKEIQASFLAGNLTFDQVIEQGAALKQAGRYDHQGQAVQFKRVSQHYYLPLLVSENEKLDYIRSVIRVASEVKFLTALEDYLTRAENRLQQFDWWLFSRVDEKSDNITIPYYYPFENRIANFKPDFIFWLQKGERYHILFVDPKGTGRAEYQHKVDGYQALFEINGKPKIIPFQGLSVSVHVSLFTEDVQFPAEGYRRYWFDNIDKMLANIAECK